MVTGIDRQVGKMVEALRESGRLENTVIVFTSDHGLYLGERGLAGKWLGHETSIRIPLIVYDPRIPESERGTWREEMVLMIDVHPTLLDWAGLSPEEGVQGASFAPIVAGQPPSDWRSEFFYEHHSFGDRIPRSEGIRTERYKYLRYIDTSPVFEELYDLDADPVEQNNLADDPGHRAVLEEMRAKWEQWHEAVR
jgi:arylsulfatase A-like enzyme